MPWTPPNAKELKALLERATDLPGEQIDRVVSAYCGPKLVRWSDTDREFARRALRRLRRRGK